MANRVCTCNGKNDPHYHCSTCDKDIGFGGYAIGVKRFCESCRKIQIENQFNNPEHYHKHEIDTITFLQKGFPPDVCMGFLKGNVVKYTQRADYKNGREDYEKVLDYAKRMLDWYDKTHS